MVVRFNDVMTSYKRPKKGFILTITFITYNSCNNFNMVHAINQTIFKKVILNGKIMVVVLPIVIDTVVVILVSLSL